MSNVTNNCRFIVWNDRKVETTTPNFNRARQLEGRRKVTYGFFCGRLQALFITSMHGRTAPRKLFTPRWCSEEARPLLPGFSVLVALFFPCRRAGRPCDRMSVASGARAGLCKVALWAWGRTSRPFEGRRRGRDAFSSECDAFGPSER